MSQIHISRAAIASDERFKNNQTTACFKFARFSRNHITIWIEDRFITEYNRVAGHGMCSKCVRALIEAGKLQPITVSQDKVIVLVTEGTKLLHDEYILKTKKYAKDLFQSCVKQNKRTPEQWNQEYNVQFNEHRQLIEDNINKANYYRMRNQKSLVSDIIKMGFEKLEAKEVKNAENHYQDSVMKLSGCIRAKNLDITKMRVVSGRVGRNIETTITDEVINVHAWTIIAEGPIKRPHYRYLVK